MKIGDLVRWGIDEDVVYGLVIEMDDYEVDFDNIQAELTELEEAWIDSMGKRVSVLLSDDSIQFMPEKSLDLMTNENR